MKKITAFFMALFPFLVVGLLFATGLISKNFTDKLVTAIEMKQEVVQVQKTTDDDVVSEELMDNVTVFPSLATDPTVYWTSADEKIATVEKETGKLTCKGFGDVRIDAVAKTNAQAKAYCTVQVWDNYVHYIDVVNKAQAQFMAPNSQLALEIKTIPSEKIEHPELSFEIKEAEHEGVTISPTGLITVGPTAANGTYTVVIKNKASLDKGLTHAITEVPVTVGSSIDSIGFSNVGTTIVSGYGYNLYQEVITSPYKDSATDPKLKPEYFTFKSSDESLATIDSKGKITFTDQYTSMTPVYFTVEFAGLYAVKQVVSTLNDYSKTIAFDKFAYTEQFDDLSGGKEITDISYHTYPVDKPDKITLTSSNDSVVKVDGKKIMAVAPGKATLTITTNTDAKSIISDSVEVTILDETNPSLLAQSVIPDLGIVYYYPLRKNLNPAFADRNIEWSIVGGGDKGVIDNEIVYFKSSGEIKVEAKDVDTNLTSTMTLTATGSAITQLNVEDGSATINVGQVVMFTKGTEHPTISTTQTELAKIDDNHYVSVHGTKGDKQLTLSDGSTFTLTVLEPLVSFRSASASEDWSNYVTNAQTFNLSEKLVAYPATATYNDGWQTYAPEITYDIKPLDESAVDFENNVLTFSKPTSVDITATAEGVSKKFKITSYNGEGGKFSMNDGTTNAVIQSGDKITKAPNEAFNLYINPDQFNVKELGDLEKVVKTFTITTLSDEKIVQCYSPKVQDNKILFTFLAKTSGTEKIKISNGSFTFVLNLEVSTAISSVDLYCLDSKLSKDKAINAYNKENLILVVDVYPLVARDETLNITFNGTKLTESARRIDISEAKVGTWQATNTLEIKNNSGVSLAKYTINDASGSGVTSFKLKDEYGIELTSGETAALRATDTYATFMIDVDGICSQDFFETKFTTTLGDKATIYGKYLIVQLDELGKEYTQEMTVSTGSISQKITLDRDMVSKIVLPKHNNFDESDKLGLQRVHVFGNKTQEKDKTTAEEIYHLPIVLYDYKGELISDLAKKNEAMKKIQSETNRDGMTAVYNTTTGNFDIKFSSNPNFLYTWKEMFDNKFTDLEKTQLFSVYTGFGKKHIIESCYAQYGFTVVNGINVYDQAGIVTASKTTEKSIVLQTNFGMTEDPTKPMKDDTPFELTSFDFNEVYGNGYAINFHAKTKAAGTQDTTIAAKHSLNTRYVGCWYDQFTGMNHRAVTFSNAGECEENNPDTFGYCTFTQFHQPLTIWCKADKKTYAHVKNCLFYNDQEFCRNAMSISDAGNTTTIENCAFFNAAKIAIMSNKGAVIQLKGDIDVYNFHGSDMFDCMGWEAALKELAWEATRAALEAANVIQSTDYGSAKPVCNSYLMTTLGGSVTFYDHTEGGKDVYISAEHGSVKAANYLKHATGLWGLLDIWSTVKPPLPIQSIHSPAYLDEFINGEQLNYNTMNKLIEKITRW